MYDTRADVYSWGVLLAELVAQKPPYDGMYLTPTQVTHVKRPKCDAGRMSTTAAGASIWYPSVGHAHVDGDSHRDSLPVWPACTQAVSIKHDRDQPLAGGSG